MTQSAGIIAVMALAAFPVAAQEVAVPSGIDLALYDVRLEDDPKVARFRFVSAAIDPAGEGREFGDLVDDLDHLCAQIVVPALVANKWGAGDVVLSVSNVETEFGVFDDKVTQFFQPYKVADGTCIWEDF